jgi:DASS family divalent anion:Na+ symporter
MKIGENLGLEKRSRGMAGLFNAMYIGWAVIGTAFMSASFVSYQMIAALPEKYRGDFSWTGWLVAMIPWAIVVVVCSYFMLVRLYRPSGSGRVPDGFIDAQIKALGPLSRNEKLVSIIFGITLCFWITEGLHGISSTLTALVCLAAMAYFNLFSVQDFNLKMMWSLIFYIGGIVNIGTIIGLQKIDTWVGDVAGPVIAPLASRPYLFAVSVAVFVYSTRFIMVSFSSLMVIVTIFLSPIGAQYGIHPWTTGIMAYSSSLIWVALYQNANMLAGWAAAGADENLDFKHVRPGAVGYLAVNILALLASVFWWRTLGHIR